VNGRPPMRFVAPSALPSRRVHFPEAGSGHGHVAPDTVVAAPTARRRLPVVRLRSLRVPAHCPTADESVVVMGGWADRPETAGPRAVCARRVPAGHGGHPVGGGIPVHRSPRSSRERSRGSSRTASAEPGDRSIPHVVRPGTGTVGGGVRRLPEGNLRALPRPGLGDGSDRGRPPTVGPRRPRLAEGPRPAPVRSGCRKTTHEPARGRVVVHVPSDPDSSSRGPTLASFRLRRFSRPWRFTPLRNRPACFIRSRSWGLGSGGMSRGRVSGPGRPEGLPGRSAPTACSAPLLSEVRRGGPASALLPASRRRDAIWTGGELPPGIRPFAKRFRV